MTDKHKLTEKARKVSSSLLDDPELAYYVCKNLNAAKIAGPWERHPEMRMVGRLCPTAPGTIRRFACHIEYTGSHFEWRALRDRVLFMGPEPMEPTMQSGKSTTMYSAMQAADRRLKEQGWILVGQPLVTDRWEGTITQDLLSREVLPGSMKRREAETGGEIVSIRWGDVPTKDGDVIEGVLIDSPAIEEIRGRVLEKRQDEPWENTIIRAKKLVDDTLRNLGWMVGVVED